MNEQHFYQTLFKDYPDVVNPKQMRKMLDINEKRAYSLLHDNKIEHFKIGTNYKIPKSCVIDYIIKEKQRIFR